MSSLIRITHGKKESLRSYIGHFTQVVVEVEGTEEGLKCGIFESGLRKDSSFRVKLGHKEARSMKEMLNMENPSLTWRRNLSHDFTTRP